MLTFQEKLAILETFPQLERKDVSLGRVNFHYENSAHDKKTVVYHLHPNGNGFVYASLLQGVSTDDKGFVNIRDYSADELRSLVNKSIASLSVKPAEEGEGGRAKPLEGENGSSPEERWIGPDNQSLTVKFEDELWYIFAGLNLEAAFETYEETEQYLREEGFTRQ